MHPFLLKHAKKIKNTLFACDRLIFKGYLPLSSPEAMEALLYKEDVLIKDFKSFVLEQAKRLKTHALAVAARTGRPFEHLKGHVDKDALAKTYAEEVDEGLLCVFSVLEPCSSFKVVPGKGRPHLERAKRMCLHYYFYYQDRDFGLMHVRLQSWFPFTIQIYVNGHQWLARQLDRNKLRYTRADNAFSWLQDPARTQQIADRLPKKNWPRTLHIFARRVNPLLKNLLQPMQYYWVTDQAEFSLDLAFKNRAALEFLYPKLLRHATLCLGAEDILGFFGRKLHGNLKAEVLTDCRKRRWGWRVKHRFRANWIKIYDKHGVVLRIEVVINQPREFKVRRRGVRKGCTVVGWFPMCKGVANLPHYRQHALRGCERYLDALQAVEDPSQAYKLLERLCEKATFARRRRRGLNPLRKDDLTLFRAVMRGEHLLRGFCHRDLQAVLNIPSDTHPLRRRRKSARLTRLIHLLRAHRLIAKIPRARRYRLTLQGLTLMGAAIFLHDQEFPMLTQRAA